MELVSKISFLCMPCREEEEAGQEGKEVNMERTVCYNTVWWSSGCGVDVEKELWPWITDMTDICSSVIAL